MPGATGIVHYMLGGGSYDTPIGLEPGGRWGEDINVQARGGIGGVGVNVPGAQISAVEASYIPVDANCLIDKILRASYPNGALTAIPLEVGDDERGMQSASWNANRAEIITEAEAALMLNLALLLTSGDHTRTAGGGDHSTCPKTTFEWYRGKTQIGGANAGVRRAAWTVENNIVPFYSLNNVVAGKQRFPEYGAKGNQMVSLAIVALQETAVDLTSDEMQAVGNVIATCINDAGSPVTITITSTAPDAFAWDTGASAHDALKEINYSLGHDPNTGLGIGIA
jgi:hypothetical protein